MLLANFLYFFQRCRRDQNAKIIFLTGSLAVVVEIADHFLQCMWISNLNRTSKWFSSDYYFRLPFNFSQCSRPLTSQHRPPIFRIIEQHVNKCSHADAQTKLFRRSHPNLMIIRFHNTRQIYDNSVRRALASCRSAVVNPSVIFVYASLSNFRARSVLPCSCHKRLNLIAARSSSIEACTSWALLTAC